MKSDGEMRDFNDSLLYKDPKANLNKKSLL